MSAIDARAVRTRDGAGRDSAPPLGSAGSGARQRLRVIALGAAAAIAGTVLLAASGWLVTRAAERPPVLALLAAIVVVRALGLVRAFGRYGERLAAHDLAFRQLAELRVRWYRRLVGGAPESAQAAPRSARAAPRSAGAAPQSAQAARTGTLSAADLLSRFVVDVDELQHRDVRVRGPVLVAVVASVAAVALAVAILPVAGLVLGGGLFVAATLVPAVAFAAARGALRRQGAARAALVDELVEAMEAAPQLALAGHGPERVARLDDASAALGQIGRRDAATAALAQGLGTLIAGATLVAVLAVAVGPASDGGLAPVWLGALALLALGAFEAVAALPEAATRAVSVAAAERRLEEAVAPASPTQSAPAPQSAPASAPSAPAPQSAPASAPSAPAPPQPAPASAPSAPAFAQPAPLSPDAVLTARSLRHRPGGAGAPAVLDGVDLELAPGRRIALVGASGAGKTVLAELLAGLVRADEGEIGLGGHAIDTLDPAVVRAQVRLAGQDAHLFATSIANNVRIGAPQATGAEIDAALRSTGLGGWLDALPDGAATLVGEEGSAVSGGQRQRIALARCLVSPARLLLLDEPTAMLDPPAARAFLADLDAAVADRGVLVITHERVGLDAFDAIWELRDGRLQLADG
ncbi:thiol reductant ABC exporter subunit CydC [Conexibacter stalactiti]|uniref:Thiol reductant ABC exporter subunit CydC n=1 Tax=Conexibacter stalactiti TaxID=1940611 RepID=A0ABU4HVG8_9ACTN|nr:thiol reductant ABC exporter subunit CydC [Conexibacter stalactiti]MDW5597159.1 thiol reductant ABC exporter subunit CydC [Conexibacter stalactiti]MEC5037801.1 thiol reductant ABC exporter subunit CydC [Conexibacter stalactiti]